MNQTEQASILVVDDDDASRDLLASVLGASGYTVRTAASGEETLAAVAQNLPEIILLDVLMPDIDGFEVARRIKADPETSPVSIIMVTILEDRESRIRSLQAGADEFLSKPVDFTELLVRVKNQLKVRKLSEFLAEHNRLLEEQVRERTAALQESEEKFRRITEAAQDAIVMMRSDGNISCWNAAAERIFGYTDKEAMGQELHALIAPAPARARFSQAFPCFRETGKGPIIGKVSEFTALRKGGCEFAAELSVSAAQFGGEWHAIGTVRDITERKQAEAKIADQLDELQRWYKAMVGRESRHIELKHEINELLREIGQPPRYPSAEPEA